MTIIDPYSDPWPNDNQALIDAFTASMDQQSNSDEQADEAFEWAMGAVVNRCDSVFLCAVEQCAAHKIKNVFEEACREKYIFAALHLVDKLPADTVPSVELAAQTGSLELLKKILGDREITKEVSNQILAGAFKGDCLEVVKHYRPNGFGLHHSGCVRFAARHNAIDCLRHFVTEPLNATDWEYSIEYAFKDYGVQTIAFLWDNPPTDAKHTVSVAEYALNIADRLTAYRLPVRNSKAFECLRLCMQRFVWKDFEARCGHHAVFQKHRNELFDLHQEPYREQLKQRLQENVVEGNNTPSRKM